MATYPNTLPISPGSRILDLDDVKIDRATNGSGRGRNLYPSVKKRFELVHAYLTPARRDVLRAFYTANRKLPFVLEYHDDQGVTLYATCMFAGVIKWDVEAGVVWKATVVCEEV